MTVFGNTACRGKGFILLNCFYKQASKALYQNKTYHLYLYCNHCYNF